ncbi:glycosyltransferase family 87 protein [Nocardioides baekrokdamisoli]|uniref:glycosyltransferase family 87 protein n=1 Tax=Nocardioides baekrokdamisoli TaxID=1804624 RepID=UPI0013DDAED0|nr:glycosyltransferase family 87 protein [Nocardioides baekrokdamisoli]
MSSPLDRFSFATTRFLTPHRLRLYPAAFLAGSVILLGFTTIVGLVSPTALPGGLAPDFLAHWTGAKLLIHDTAHLYDPTVQAAIEHRRAGDPLAWFVSAPVEAALFVPLGLLPYRLAAAIWLAISLGCLAISWRLMRAWAPQVPRLPLLIALASTEPIFELLGGGQDSSLILLCWLGGMTALDRRRPFLGGALLGLAMIKPQLIILAPVVLLVRREWRALGGFVLTSFLCGAVSLALVGPSGLRTWIDTLTSPAYDTLVTHAQAWKMSSLPALVQGLLPAGGSITADVVAVVCAVIAVWGASRATTLRGAWAIALSGTAVASPHLLVYDLVVVFPAVVWLVRENPSPRVRATLAVTYLLLWTVPLRHAIANGHAALGWLDVPWQAIPITSLALYAIRQAATEGSRTASLPH